MSYDVSRVLAVAEAEVGYLEKKSNAQLDDKTANAGSKNYTKYARDLDKISGFYNGRKQSVAWCDVFVDWCFVMAYGVEAAKKLLCQPGKSAGAGCRYSRNYYKQKGQLCDTPQPGDQIFFWPKDRSDPNKVQHTGLVYKVDTTYVYTIEGNTSGASGVIANGGGVCKKKYKLSYNRLAGYGRPDWNMDGVVEKDIHTGDARISTPVEYKLGGRTLLKGYEGSDVKELQELLMQLGYKLTKYGADGKYGAETMAAVKAFQKSVGLTQDGLYGDKTHAALMDAVADDEQGKDEARGAEPDDGDSPSDSAPETEDPAVQRVEIISENKVNIRVGNGTNYSRITQVLGGTTYEWVATAINGWHAVIVGSRIGWVSGKYSRIIT